MTEEKMIDAAFADLMKSLRKETTEENRQLIRRAFEFAREAHDGCKRRCGDPYILHPIAVAKIVAVEIGLGTKSVVAALLHDVVEDTDYVLDDISKLFGPKIASLVDGLTKISGVMGSSSASKQAETFRKVILTLADDVRVILIKIADRLHNMRTLDFMPEHKQVKIAGETLFIFAPLAHRMGLHAIKTELEDLSLKYENPEDYRILAKEIHKYEEENEVLFQRFIAPIQQVLTERGYKFEITARTKSVYSVWSKMQKRNIPFEEVYDVAAVRIVFKPKRGTLKEKSQCWNIYSLITDLYMPKQDRIRDWVSVPKANGYEALHATVMGPGGRWIEVQIRTTRMDEIAEKGLAAHWKYKGDSDPDSELDKWLISVKEMLEEMGTDALVFMDNFRTSLFVKEIRAFTPKGDMRTLPKGATVLDFAYDIHTEIGNTCIGGKVNRRLVPMSHVLHNGDQVEILTTDKQKPQSDWLDFVVTGKAKNHINAAFRKERKDMIRRGSLQFEQLLKEMNLPLTSESLKKALLHLNLSHKDELYLGIAKKQITMEEVKKAMKRKSENKFVKYWNLQFFKSDKDKQGKEKQVKNGSEAEKEEGLSDIIIATDCNPIPGDDVVGLKTEEGKIMVHKRKCPEAIRLMSSYGDRIVPVKWVSHKIMSFLAAIKLNGIDNIGMVSEITHVISKENNVNMRTVHVDTKDGIFEGIIHLYVHNTADLNNLMMKIASIKGVENVIRVENEM